MNVGGKFLDARAPKYQVLRHIIYEAQLIKKEGSISQPPKYEP